MRTRGASKRNLERNTEQCMTSIQQSKTTSKTSASIKKENEQIQSPTFNFHIHIPPVSGNVSMPQVPSIQPVIHLHFDDLMKKVNLEGTSAFQNSVNLLNLLALASPKSVNVTASVDGESSFQTSKMNFENLNLSQRGSRHINESVERDEDGTDSESNCMLSNKTTRKKNQRHKTNNVKGSIMAKYNKKKKDKDFRSISPSLKKNINSLIKNYLQRSTSSLDETVREHDSADNSENDDDNSVSKFTANENIYKFKKAVVVLKDISPKTNHSSSATRGCQNVKTFPHSVTSSDGEIASCSNGDGASEQNRYFLRIRETPVKKSFACDFESFQKNNDLHEINDTPQRNNTNKTTQNDSLEDNMNESPRKSIITKNTTTTSEKNILTEETKKTPERCTEDTNRTPQNNKGTDNINRENSDREITNQTPSNSNDIENAFSDTDTTPENTGVTDCVNEILEKSFYSDNGNSDNSRPEKNGDDVNSTPEKNSIIKCMGETPKNSPNTEGSTLGKIKVTNCMSGTFSKNSDTEDTIKRPKENSDTEDASKTLEKNRDIEDTNKTLRIHRVNCTNRTFMKNHFTEDTNGTLEKNSDTEGTKRRPIKNSDTDTNKIFRKNRVTICMSKTLAKKSDTGDTNKNSEKNVDIDEMLSNLSKRQKATFSDSDSSENNSSEESETEVYKKNVKNDEKLKKSVEIINKGTNSSSDSLDSESEEEKTVNSPQKVNSLEQKPKSSSTSTKGLGNDKLDGIPVKSSYVEPSSKSSESEDSVASEETEPPKNQELATSTRTNSTVFDLVHNSDKEATLENDPASVIVGCNFSEILSKIKNQSVRDKIMAMAERRRTISQSVQYKDKPEEVEEDEESNNSLVIDSGKEETEEEKEEIEEKEEEGKEVEEKKNDNLDLNSEDELTPRSYLTNEDDKSTVEYKDPASPSKETISDYDEPVEPDLRSSCKKALFRNSEYSLTHSESDKNKKNLKRDLSLEGKEIQDEFNVISKKLKALHEDSRQSPKYKKKDSIDTNEIQIECINKEMKRRSLAKKSGEKKKQKPKPNPTKGKEQKKDVPPLKTSPPAKTKKLKTKPQVGADKPSIKFPLERNYIPLQSSGSTRFGVAPLDQLNPYREHKAFNFKHEMLFGDRVKRFSSKNELKECKLKQEARRGLSKPFNL